MSSATLVSLCIRGNQGILKMKNDKSWKCVEKKEVKNRGTSSRESNKLCIFSFYRAFFMITNPNSCFVYCFLILADILSECLSSCLPAVRTGILTSCWPNLGEVKITEVAMKLSIHRYNGAALCSQDGRRGFDRGSAALALWRAVRCRNMWGPGWQWEGVIVRSVLTWLPHCWRYAEGLWWGLLVNTKYQTDKWTHHNQEPCFKLVLFIQL